MRLGFFLLLLMVALFLEGSVTTVPLFLSILIVMAICRINPWLIYAVSFLGGIYLDIAHVGVIGMTGLVFIFFLFIISLYERKFEISSFQFAGFSSLLAAATFLIIFQREFVVYQSIIVMVITLILFTLFYKREKTTYGEL